MYKCSVVGQKYASDNCVVTRSSDISAHHSRVFNEADRGNMLATDEDRIDMDLNDFFVEVIREDGAWYRALVHEFDNEGIEVTFPNTQLPATTVRYDQVKPVHTGVRQQNRTNMEIGQKCEIQLLCKEGSPIGWVAATIKDARGDFYVVEYKTKKPDGSELTSSDIVPCERIRSPNNQDTMSPGCLFRYRVNPSETLEELFKTSDDKSHKILKEPLSPARLYFDKTSKYLILLTDSPTCLKRASMMIDMHLKCLDIKSSIMRRSKTALDRAKYTSGTHTARHSCEFQLHESLMGLAIGTHGANITNARHLPGVTHIDTDRDTNTFRIYGDTDDAVRKARSMLEFEERPIMIPRKVIGRVIGKNGSAIQNIVDRSQVLRVKVEGDKERTGTGDEDKVPLIFTGTVESIENAKILLDFYIAHILEIDELSDKLKKITEEINKHAYGNGSGKSVPGKTSYYHQGHTAAPVQPYQQSQQPRLVDYGAMQPPMRAQAYSHNQPGMHRGGQSGPGARQPYNVGQNFGSGPMGIGHQQPSQMSGNPRHFYDNPHDVGHEMHPRNQRRPRPSLQQPRPMQPQASRQYGGQIENGTMQISSPDAEGDSSLSSLENQAGIHMQNRPQPAVPSSAHQVTPSAES